MIERSSGPLRLGHLTQDASSEKRFVRPLRQPRSSERDSRLWPAHAAIDAEEGTVNRLKGPGTRTQATTDCLCTSSHSARQGPPSNLGYRRHTWGSRLGNLRLALETTTIGTENLHATLMTGFAAPRLLDVDGEMPL